jgi:hypothetical protein
VAGTAPSDDRLREVYARVERAVEDRWGIPVLISDVPHPFTGDLDGAEIKVDHANAIEDAVFILVHLFGHTVQWNVSAEARAIAVEEHATWSDADLERIGSYEREACAYSLQLLHDCGIHDLDQWISDFAACDAAYLMHFYRTGEKRDLRSFWRDDQPLVPPRPIPEFQPKKWLSRWGTVV